MYTEYIFEIPFYFSSNWVIKPMWKKTGKFCRKAVLKNNVIFCRCLLKFPSLERMTSFMNVSYIYLPIGWCWNICSLSFLQKFSWIRQCVFESWNNINIDPQKHRRSGQGVGSNHIVRRSLYIWLIKVIKLKAFLPRLNTPISTHHSTFGSKFTL